MKTELTPSAISYIIKGCQSKQLAVNELKGCGIPESQAEDIVKIHAQLPPTAEGGFEFADQIKPILRSPKKK